MSTASTKGPQHQTLEQRIEARYENKTYKSGSAYQVRAELDRLARKVRKLNILDFEAPGNQWILRKDVLDAMREAKS
jgi:hypothetical protein